MKQIHHIILNIWVLEKLKHEISKSVILTLGSWVWAEYSVLNETLDLYLFERFKKYVLFKNFNVNMDADSKGQCQAGGKAMALPGLHAGELKMCNKHFYNNFKP